MAERFEAQRHHDAAGVASEARSAEAAAALTLAQLDAQAESVRLELTRLRRELADAERVFDSVPTARLLEANEHLLLAAMRADAIAKKAEAELDELTRAGQRDALTGQPNRALMLDRLQNAIAIAERHETRLAVLFIDIDDFKRINDTHGHAVGDEVLQSVAQRLASVVRASDTVSRYGGDEFVVILPELAQASDAAVIAIDMKTALAQDCATGGGDVRPSASIGIALYPDDGTDAATLIRRADAAMYREKRRESARPASGDDPANRNRDAPGSTTCDAPRAAADGMVTRPRRESPLRDLREANEQLIAAALTAQELKAAAEAARNRHVRFLAMVAHELRNPLAPIRSAAELLGRVGMDEALLARVQDVIHRQVTHMARLLDDLVDSSHAAGGFRIERSPVDMSAILALAIDGCRSGFEARGQTFETELPPAPLWIDGDPARLAQIFGNLLDNASKYTPDGGEIALTAAVQGRSLVVRVADNGIGLSSAALPAIFDLFVRDPNAVAHRRDGLGIGLAVVRELVEAHDGSVIARSSGEGRGSEFVVTLPLLGDTPAA